MRIARTTFMAALAIAAFLSAWPVMPAHAALNATGPNNPVSTVPNWIQDTQGLALELCLDQTLVGGVSMCVLPPNFDADPAVAGLRTPPNAPFTPITATGPINNNNFPDESFYWIADTPVLNLGPGGGAKFSLRMALEVAFLSGVSPNTGIVFLRVNVKKMSGLTPNSTYTVTYPFGSFTFDSDVNGDTVGGAQAYRAEDGCFGAPCNTALNPLAFNQLLPAANTNMGPFLIWDPNVAPAAPAGFIGDPAIAHKLINPASPATPIVVTLTGPDIGGPGVNAITPIDQFTLAGKKVGLDVVRTPATNPVTTLVGTPADIQVTVANITGTLVSFTANPFAVTGTNAADFTVVEGLEPCSGTTLQVPPATPNSCAFAIRFNPAATTAAQRDATITLTPTDTTVAPPATIPVTGIAKYRITPTTSTSVTNTGVRVAGTISPSVAQDVNAGGTATFTLTPETGYFTRVLIDNIHTFITGNTVDFSGLSNHHILNVKFVRNGDLVEDGIIKADDALRALQVALGIGAAATHDEMTAADVGPLVAGKTKADGSVDVSDVLVILRRAVGLDPAW